MIKTDYTKMNDEHLEIESAQSRAAMNERMRRNEAKGCTDKMFYIGSSVKVTPQLGDVWRGFVFSNDGDGAKIGVFTDDADGNVTRVAWVEREQLLHTGGGASF